MTSFSDEAWTLTATLRQAIHRLPFNIELAAGKLSRDRFQAYIIQDSLYLAEYRRVLLLAAAKAPLAAASQFFAEAAVGVLTVEEALHGQFLQAFGVAPGEITRDQASPDCLAYTSFLLATAHEGPWEVLVAALLPCFWIYRDVGLAIAGRTAPGNPYQAWIDTYADEHFGEAVRRAIAIADEAGKATSAEGRGRMLEAFERSSQFEWLFWDGAYQGRGWPVAKAAAPARAE